MVHTKAESKKLFLWAVTVPFSLLGTNPPEIRGGKGGWLLPSPSSPPPPAPFIHQRDNLKWILAQRFSTGCPHLPLCQRPCQLKRTSAPYPLQVTGHSLSSSRWNTRVQRGRTEGHPVEVMVGIGTRTLVICSVCGQEPPANPFGLKCWSAELACS